MKNQVDMVDLVDLFYSARARVLEITTLYKKLHRKGGICPPRPPRPPKTSSSETRTHALEVSDEP